MTKQTPFGRVVAMAPDLHRQAVADYSAAAALMAAGMAPKDAQAAAWNGAPTVALTVAGDTGTICLHGQMVARAPWFAKAFAGICDPYDVVAVLDAVARNPQFAAIKTVIIEVDSGGGTVNGSGEIAAALARVQASGRTVEARINGMCASGAYRAICGADTITASADSLVGAIGVYCIIEDETAAQSAEGCKPEVISSAPLKGAGMDGRITPEYRAERQRIVSGLAAVFYDAVSSARALTGPALDAVTTGQVWLAADAKALGLIDAVADAPDAQAKAENTTPPDPVIPVTEIDAEEKPNPQAAILPPNKTESAMDPKTQAALSALSTSHPHLSSALIGEAIKTGTTPEALEAFAAKADLAAKDEKIKALEASLIAANSKASEAVAAANRLGAHLPQHGDPGQGDAGPAKDVRIIPIAKAAELTADDWTAIKAGQAKFG